MKLDSESKHHMISLIYESKKKKKSTNELSKTQKLKNLWLPKGTGMGGEVEWDLGIGI